jgi:hypothetical protein
MMTLSNKDVDTGVEETSSPLAVALAAFQAVCPPIKKANTAKVTTRTGGEYSYDYADLTAITEAAYPLLSKHGLSFSTLPTLTPNDGFVLQYRLMHTSGEFLEGVYPLPDPSGQDVDTGKAITPQQLGSAITYARRYSLCAVTGIAPGGDDDDAGSAQTTTRAKPAPKQKPVPKPTATRPWKAEVDRVKDLDELFELHDTALNLGELGLAISADPSDGTVSDYMAGKRDEMTPAALAAPPGQPVTEWDTATPGGGK